MFIQDNGYKYHDEDFNYEKVAVKVSNEGMITFPDADIQVIFTDKVKNIQNQNKRTIYIV